MIDITLHILAGALLTILALQLPGEITIVFVMTMAGLLRELAQKDRSNLLRALSTMPSWSWRHHAEWVSWGVGSAIAAGFF